jgi:predicted nucleotidyltransferase
MLTTVEDITKRIVDIYEPDLIILYGSHARGSQRDGSDADILIIKETDERPIDRRIRVEGIIYMKKTEREARRWFLQARDANAN